MDRVRMGNLGEQPQGAVLLDYKAGTETTCRRDGKLGAHRRRNRPRSAPGRKIAMTSGISQLVSKVRGLFGQREADSEFDLETQTHLQLLTEQFVRKGMDPKDAWSAARRQFGNTTLLRQSHHESRSLFSFPNLLLDLRVMGLKTALGHSFDDSDFGQGHVKSILLGYEFWQRAFGGDKDIIGKTVRISRWDSSPVVIGIMEPGVRFLPSPGAAKEPNYDVNATVDFWVPVEPNPKNLKDPYWNVVARLRDGATPQQGQRELAVLTGR